MPPGAHGSAKTFSRVTAFLRHISSGIDRRGHTRCRLQAIIVSLDNVLLAILQGPESINTLQPHT